MPGKNIAYGGVFPQPFQYGMHGIPLALQHGFPGIRPGTGHVVLGVIAGDNHKGQKPHPPDLLPAQGFPYRVQMGEAIHGSHADAFHIPVVQHREQMGVGCVGKVAGAMPHKDKRFVFAESGGLAGNQAAAVLVVLRA